MSKVWSDFWRSFFSSGTGTGTSTDSGTGTGAGAVSVAIDKNVFSQNLAFFCKRYVFLYVLDLFIYVIKIGFSSSYFAFFLTRKLYHHNYKKNMVTKYGTEREERNYDKIKRTVILRGKFMVRYQSEKNGPKYAFCS